MRVGLVCGHLDPARDGVADYTGRLATSLRARGVDAPVLTGFDFADPARDVLGATERWDAAGVRRAAQAIARLGLQAVHVQFAPSAFGFSRAVGLLPLLLPRTPMVVTLHEYGVWAGHGPGGIARSALWSVAERRGLLDRETLLLVPRARWLLAAAGDHLQVLRSRFPGRDFSAVEVPIGSNIPVVQLDRAQARSAVRREQGMPPDAPLVVFFGFLHPVKALDRLIEAVARVRRTHPGLRLLLLGGGESHSVRAGPAAELRSRLEQVATQHGVERDVVFTGYLPEAEVSRLLQAADAAVFPFDAGVTLKSSSLLAALAHGVPTIATAPPPGISRPSEVDGVLRVPPSDTEVLAEALGLVLADPTLAGRLAGAGRARADRHGWEHVATVHAEVYTQVLAQAGTQRPARR